MPVLVLCCEEQRCGEMGHVGLGCVEAGGMQRRGAQSQGAQGRVHRAGELWALCGVWWEPVLSNGACKGALVGCHSVVWPGDTRWLSLGPPHSDVGPVGVHSMM